MMCTDITRDGMMDGTAIGLYRELLRLYAVIRLIASGGVIGWA
ncbi:HisA/HisF-related TIM barrel protein, partial [Odoribacter splanchnicus]